MFSIKFYKDKNGKCAILDYIRSLDARKDKDSRIKVNKIYDYIDILREAGTKAGEPFMKHLDDDIWGLRPLRDRILFAVWDGKGFILLHHFIKKTQKTPSAEIEQTKRNLKDFIERSGQ